MVEPGQEIQGQQPDRGQEAPQPGPQSVRFLDHELDLRGRLLSSDGEAIKLPPRIYTLLEFFVRRAGEAIERETLIEALWPGVAVSDQSLTEAVWRLRKALGDDPKAPRYIETIPGYGFRFAPKVEPLGAEGELAVTEVERWPSLWKLALPGAALSGLMLTIAFIAGVLPATTAPVERVTLSLITFADGAPVRDFAAELSPDGGTLALVRNDPPRLLAMNPTTEETVVLGALERIWAGRQLRWAPDGRTLAMSGVPEPGGPGVVELFATVPGASPERRRILESPEGPVRVLGWEPTGERLLLWAADETSPRLLSMDRSGAILGDWPAGPISEGRVSPDGRWLAVSLSNGGPGEIVIVPIESVWSEESPPPAEQFLDWQRGVRISDPPVADDAPHWNAASDGLVYFAASQGGRSALWRVDLQNGAPVQQPRVLGVPASPYQVQGWAPNGDLVFSTYSRTRDVVLLDVDLDEGTFRTPPVVLSLAGGSARIGLWSTDPNRVMYTSFHEDRPEGDLYIAELDAAGQPVGPERVRVEVEGRLGWPSWAPDGERVYFWEQHPDRSFTLHEQEIATGERRRLLPDDVFGWLPRGSLDASGRLFLFNNSVGPALEGIVTRAPGMYLLDLETGNLRRVAATQRAPALAPDGSWAALPNDDYDQLLALDLGNGETSVLAEAPAGGWQITTPEITPDGSRVIYAMERPPRDGLCEDRQLWVVNAAGGEPRHLEAVDEWHPSHGSVSPDGRRLALSTFECSDAVMRYIPPRSRRGR